MENRPLQKNRKRIVGIIFLLGALLPWIMVFAAKQIPLVTAQGDLVILATWAAIMISLNAGFFMLKRDIPSAVKDYFGVSNVFMIGVLIMNILGVLVSHQIISGNLESIAITISQINMFMYPFYLYFTLVMLATGLVLMAGGGLKGIKVK